HKNGGIIINSRLKNQIICAVLAAVTAVLSQIQVPIGPVPINLAMLSVFIAGGLLSPNLAALSQLIFVLLGAIGLPVFAGFSGGIGVLAGPTGGYIAGYIAAAWLTSFIIKKSGSKSIVIVVLAMIAGLAVCYTLGTAWFVYSRKVSIAKALMLCVVPFLIGDALKIAAASLISQRLKRIKQLALQ
ncbi:MAG TPA: biotin transporter BioY, partial [Ruminococcaceae bacterium]|nr:biotin transporter BioY [Oscillospiraceae bacterium]